MLSVCMSRLREKPKMDIILAKSADFDNVINAESREGKGSGHDEEPEGVYCSFAAGWLCLQESAAVLRLPIVCCKCPVCLYFRVSIVPALAAGAILNNCMGPMQCQMGDCPADGPSGS